MKVEVDKNSVFIAGVEYVPKGESVDLVTSVDGLQYVIVRTYSAGVHIGYLQSKEYTQSGIVVKLIKTRRVYSWSGAMTLSQLAIDGSSKPEKCQITVEIPENELVAIEIMPVTEKSFKSLISIAEWKI